MILLTKWATKTINMMLVQMSSQDDNTGDNVDMDQEPSAEQTDTKTLEVWIIWNIKTKHLHNIALEMCW